MRERKLDVPLESAMPCKSQYGSQHSETRSALKNERLLDVKRFFHSRRLHGVIRREMAFLVVFKEDFVFEGGVFLL